VLSIAALKPDPEQNRRGVRGEVCAKKR